ncbi:MAG: TonB-dependent receptor plug domain-containing protein, partial [Vitreimonas sp.]
MKLKTKIGLLGATFLTAATFGLASPAAAQTTPETLENCPTGTVRNADGSCTEPEEEEEIVVTGSRLRRDPATVGTPLIQVPREEVMNSGEANVVDYLADIPALSASIVPEDTVGAGLGDGGLSLLNLRNLGADRTLVLVDGRRHVGSGQGSPNVDIDTIPRL